MNAHSTQSTRKRIAIIGSGISGLGAAYGLHEQHDITLYEAADRLGGHSRTMEVPTADGNIPVDTGFIVFNHRNYPLLTALFEHLDVPTSESDMSFGVRIEAEGKSDWLEYGTRKLTHLFAQKRNLFRPAYWKMLRDIMTFNQQAPNYLERDTSFTLEDALDEMQLGDWFRRYYLLSMGASIWSTPYKEMMRFPASTFLRFFQNHGLLTVNDQPQWHTVQGGSREYVSRISEPFKNRIRLNTPVKQVKRLPESGVGVTDAQGNTETYDEVVFACHSDQALKMIDTPTDAESEILSAIPYLANTAVLHTDASFMPRRKSAWASWVYLSETPEDNSEQVSLTYWMNNLQPLATMQPIFVTLNPAREPDPATVIDRHEFHHPQFDSTAVAAQARLPEIQGYDRFWFCGAYWRYGFHEDGLLSAVNMLHDMGIGVPWSRP